MFASSARGRTVGIRRALGSLTASAATARGRAPLQIVTASCRDPLCPFVAATSTRTSDDNTRRDERRFYSQKPRSTNNYKASSSTSCDFRRASSSSSKSRPRHNAASHSSSGKHAIDDLLDRMKQVQVQGQGRPHSPSHDEVVGWIDETRDILASLVAAVENRQLNPSGKHGKSISDTIERILRAYHQISLLSSKSPSEEGSTTTTTPCFEYCQEALDTLSLWNLNFRHGHYEHAIAVANNEEKWKEASNLFWRQIDPGAGYNPVHVSVADPQGLYAIARFAQQEQSAVAELVFDAVLQLCMVSPQDQTTYVLAAGTALGKAGEWESAVEFLNASYTTNQLGQHLVSSVMQACLLSGRPEEAMQVYEVKFHSGGKKTIAEEWQWGGDRDTLDPVARDLVMRAIEARDGASSLALELFDDCITEGVTISSDALLGVLKACEHDRNMHGALSVFDYILDSATRKNWIVPGAELAIHDCESEEATRLSNGTVAARWLPQMSEHMATVMRTCNSNSSFGTGLFYLKRVDLLMRRASSPQTITTPRGYHVQTRDVLQSMLLVFTTIQSGTELLVPTMVSLCGLRCYEDAFQLFDHLENREDQGQRVLREGLAVRQYAESEFAKNGQSVVGNPWTSALRHIHRLTTALQIIEETGHNLTKREEDQILKGLAAAMQSCTNAHHPDLSLRLLAYVAKCLRGDSLIVGGRQAIDPDQSQWKELAVVNDVLTAEIIHALGWTNNLVGAVEIFHSVLDQETSRLAKWRSTCSAGLSALVKLGRGEEAVKIFEELDKTTLSADCYNEIGRFFLRNRNTKELGNLYNLALNSGNLSEELSLMAMTAVVKSKMDNRVRVLRAMVDDNAKYVGTSRERWMKTRYWNVKRALGFFHARLLMWWNDTETCHLDELDFAISEFNSQKAVGMKVKNDVLRAIANSARLFNADIFIENDTRWSLVPQTKDDWTELLLKVIEECNSFSISYDADFIDTVVAAFRHLGANRECVAFVADVLERGVRVHRSTLSRALEAANAEHSIQLASEIQLLISEI